MALPLIAAAAASTALSAALGQRKSDGFSRGDLEFFAAGRANQIQDFERALAAARARYLARIPQLQSEAFGRFMPDFEAKLAARGLQANGGAFGSGLGKEAASKQAELELLGFQAEREDLNAVNDARGALSAAMLGGAYNRPMQVTSSPLAQSLAQFGGTMASEYVSDRRLDRELRRRAPGGDRSVIQ